MQATDLMQKVEFINETLTPSEARDIISKIFDHQINFYKVQNLSNWMRNHEVRQEPINEKLSLLKQKKQAITEILNEAKSEGRQIKLCCDFDISIED